MTVRYNVSVRSFPFWGDDIFEYDRDYIANIVGFASFRDLLESDDE